MIGNDVESMSAELRSTGTGSKCPNTKTTWEQKEIKDKTTDSWSQVKVSLRCIELGEAWSTWSEWTSCTGTCSLTETGIKSRTRTCLDETIGCTADSINSAFEEKICTLQCNELSNWSEWSECSVSTCPYGKRNRYKSFQNGTKIFEYDETCTSFFQCPPFYQAWSEWSTCSDKCSEKATQSRERVCKKYFLSDTRECYGANIQTKQCDNKSCLQSDQWSSWTNCTCDLRELYKTTSNIPNGFRINTPFRLRKRDSMKNKVELDYSSCRELGLTECAQWSSWSNWSGCNKNTCENGQVRSRSCPENAICGTTHSNQESQNRNCCETVKSDTCCKLLMLSNADADANQKLRLGWYSLMVQTYLCNKWKHENRILIRYNQTTS